MWLFLLFATVVISVRADPVVVYATWDPQSENKVVLHYHDSSGHVQRDSSPPRHYTLRATYDNTINKTGWAFLEMHTNPGFDDETQAFTVGFVEGVTTADLIAMHWTNTMADYCSDSADGPKGRPAACRAVQSFLEKNRAWVDDMVASHSDTDPYWHQVKLYYKQLEGLYAGYRSALKLPDLTLNDFLWLNLQSDIDDLMQAVGGLNSSLGGDGCSGLVRLLPLNRDLLVGHATWSGYNTMLRVQKKVVLPVRATGRAQGAPVPGHVAVFSSYPGVIGSVDDFYVLSSGLVAVETTIGNNNASLWSYVRPRGQVLESVRNIVANRLSADGRTWVKTLSRYNSGTYNNQWFVVDFKRFKPGKSGGVSNGTLWVLEQLPGLVRYQDRTEELRKNTYWASYNAPADPIIFNTGGFQDLVKKFGDWFTHDKTPRALIFKRDFKTAHNLPSMLRLMTSNDYQHDPLSRCNCTPPYSAENAIAARCDLNPKNGTYPFPSLGHRSHGAIDAKVTNSTLVSKLQFLSVSGPTTGSHLPPFQWSKSDFGDTISHVGHPDRWTFKPILHEWHWHSSH
ncbi:putative phospholipase B-like 2 [Schistocerca piceifrons]|uniref:putative phospholipase B-like 2 n=1 Tax=Schistocerca piceifrons TaxID=274613 RepID=UPI001F5F5929|nr:putative phospholipase B-like 2 [Schistocerca piceifrons]